MGVVGSSFASYGEKGKGRKLVAKRGKEQAHLGKRNNAHLSATTTLPLGHLAIGRRDRDRERSQREPVKIFRKAK
jgi:hypothetical protein